MASTRASENSVAIDAQDLLSFEDASTVLSGSKLAIHSIPQNDNPIQSALRRFRRGLGGLLYGDPVRKRVFGQGSNAGHPGSSLKEVKARKGFKSKGEKAFVVPPVDSREVQNRVDSLEKQLSAQRVKDSTRAKAYMDLFDLLCLILHAPPDTYHTPPILKLWAIFLRELQVGHTEHVVAAIANRTFGDVVLVLGCLARSRADNWKLPLQFDSDTPSARSAFGSKANLSLAVLERAFFDLLCRLLQYRPYAVHAALDNHAHLVWSKSVVSDRGIIDFASVLESLSYAYQTYWKHSNPSQSGDVEALILFLTSPLSAIEAIVAEWVRRKGHDDALVPVVEHICTSLATIAASSFPRVPGDPQASDYPDTVPDPNIPTICPSVFAGNLAHPALPFILFAAELVWHSPRAVTLLTADSDDALEGSLELVGSLSTLWEITSKFTCRERREHPMCLAVCYLFACMAASAHQADQAGDPTAMDGLIRRMTSSPRLIAWLWDLTYTAMSLQVHYVNPSTITSTSNEREEFGEVYAYRLPSILHLFHRVFTAEHPALLKLALEPKHRSPSRKSYNMDERLVSAILYSAMTSLSWKAVLDMFGVCIDDKTLSQIVGDAYGYGQTSRSLEGEHGFEDCRGHASSARGTALGTIAEWEPLRPSNGHSPSSDTPHPNITHAFPAQLLGAARCHAIFRYKAREPSLMQEVLAELDRSSCTGLA